MSRIIVINYVKKIFNIKILFCDVIWNKIRVKIVKKKGYWEEWKLYFSLLGIAEYS